MTDVKELIKIIVEPLVSHPEDIQVSILETERFTEYNLQVNSEDVGRVIGKQGRVAQSIRTIVYGVRTPNHKRARLNIVDA